MCVCVCVPGFCYVLSGVCQVFVKCLSSVCQVFVKCLSGVFAKYLV